MTAKIEQYVYLFSHLRKGVTQYGPAPHKLILLLAVIKNIELGRIKENQIVPTDALVDSFLSIWKEFIHTGHKATFALPFFHLQNEHFWHLHAYPGKASWLQVPSSVCALGPLRDAVQYASLDDDLFSALSTPESREILKQTLISSLEQDGYKRPCPFCQKNDREIIAESEFAFAFYDHFPVSPGHTLIVPKRHVASYFDLQRDELWQMNELSFSCKNILQKKYHPTGFNLGINVGLDAGQSIFHCHMHLIPRYYGDVPNPRGGVRGVIPLKQNY